MARDALTKGYAVAKKTLLVDFTTVAATLATFANATGAAVSKAADNAVRCTWTSATSAQYMGCKYEHPTGTWDLSEAWREGFSIGVDVGFPPGGVSTAAFDIYLQVYLVNDSGTAFTNYVRTGAMGSGFNKLRRQFFFHNKVDFGSGAGTFNPAAVKRIEIRALCNAAAVAFPVTMDIYGFYVNAKSRTQVMLMWDDEFTSCYTEGYLGTTGRGLIDYGWKGTLYVLTNLVNESGRMTTANIQTLIDAGWSVGQHADEHNPLAYNLAITSSGTTATATGTTGSVDHGKLAGETITIADAFYPEYNGTFVIQTVPTSLSFTYTMSGTPAATVSRGRPYMVEWQSDQWRKDRMNNARTWMDANLTGHTKKHMAYVNGGLNQNAVDIISGLGYLTARTVDTGGWPSYGIGNQVDSVDLLRLPSIDMSNTATAASILASVDSCIKYGSSVCIYGHLLVTTPTLTTEFSLAQWDLLLAGLRARELNGLIDIVTIEQFYTGLTNPRD